MIAEFGAVSVTLSDFNSYGLPGPISKSLSLFVTAEETKIIQHALNSRLVKVFFRFKFILFINILN